MDRKTEDLIARLAFGELTEAESAQVRAMAGRDADSAKALDSYELLRSDLRQMRDVPPDQLSKERLQSAILAQGLKPRPVRHGFPWIWAPAATVVAALALFVLMRPSEHSPISGSTVVVGNPHRGLDTLDPSALNPDDVDTYSRAIDRSLVFEPSAPERSTSSDPVPVVTAAKAQPSVRTFKPRRLRERPVARIREQSAGATLALTPSAGKRVVVPATQPRESIVLIQTERDWNTGAKSAVEVQQTEDVIVSS